MTTNKLPPLPEYVAVLSRLMDVASVRRLNFEERSEFAEALRQSQSLPAGAVAGLVGKWRDRTNYADTGDEVDTLNYCADELEQALQADAREKGEVVSAEDHRTAAAIDAALTGTGFLVDGQHVAPSRVEMIRVPVPFATHPAQASEKDRLAAMVEHGMAGVDWSSHKQPLHEADGSNPAEAVAWQFRVNAGGQWLEWAPCTENLFDEIVEFGENRRRPAQARALYTHPQPVTTAGEHFPGGDIGVGSYAQTEQFKADSPEVTPAGREVDPSAMFSAICRTIALHFQAGKWITGPNTLALALEAVFESAHPPVADAALLCFVSEVMDEWHEGDLDGGQRQDLALKYGLLDEVRVTEACGDLCQCAEYGDFPQMCYRPSSLLKQCRAAREKPARAAIDAALNQRGGG